MTAELSNGAPDGNKLSCGIGTVEELEDLVAGTLAPVRAAAVAAHADSCAVCARELGWLRAEHELFTQRARGVPPSQVWSQVEARLSARLASQLAARPAPTRWRDRLRSQKLQWVAVGAAAALMGIVAASPLSPLKHGFFQRPAGSAPGSELAGAMVPRFDAFDHDDTSVGGGPSEQEDVVTARFKLTGLSKLALDTSSADVSVQVGAPDEVVVRAEETGAHAVSLVERGKGLMHLAFDGREQADSGEIQVVVPAGTSLLLHTLSGDITVGEVRGDVELRSTSGDMHVRGARKVDVVSTSGDVVIEQATGPLNLVTTSGDVLLKEDVTSPVKFDSTSGSLQLYGACRAGCQVRAHTISGDVALHASRSSLVARLRTRSGEISGADHLTVEMRRRAGDKSEWTLRLGRSEGSLELDSESGGLELRPE